MEEIPAEFWHAVEQFNQRQFYACHDTLEAIWMEAPQPDKKFYQGILQVAVGLYHFGNLNWRGAVISMGEGLGRLQNYLPDYAEIDVESFVVDTSQLLKLLQEKGADAVADLLEQITQTDETCDRRLVFPVLKRAS